MHGKAPKPTPKRAPHVIRVDRDPKQKIPAKWKRYGA